MGMFEDAIVSLKNKIKTMVQRTAVTLSKPVVPGEYPTYQVKALGTSANVQNSSSFLGKPTDVENISPYGLASTLPLGASGIKLNIQGESSNQVGIAYDPATLPALLSGGEVAVGNFKAGTFLKFTNLGTIEVFQNGVLVITDLIKHTHSTSTDPSGPPNLIPFP